MINPGNLRHKITIQEKVLTSNEHGYEVEQWQDWMTVWASKSGLSGREYYAAASIQSENDVIYKIRYVQGVNSDMRIVEGTNTYDIKSVVDKDGRKKELFITVTEVL
jgi:SPP1 family predicted phage head-tail adaptor